MPLLLPKVLRPRLPSIYTTMPTSLLNPLTFLSPIILLTLSIPLFFLALITSTLAFTTLALRVGLVYFELGRAVITSWVLEWSYGIGRGKSSKGGTIASGTGNAAGTEDLETFYKQQQAATMEGKRRRRSHPYPRYNLNQNPSIVTAAPTQPPVPSTSAAHAQSSTSAHIRAKAKSTSSSLANLRNTQAYGLTQNHAYQPHALQDDTPQASLHRDFEGIGGWRFPSSIAPPNSADDHEDAVWMSFNSRLQLPTTGQGISVGSISPGPGGSAVTSGQATPRAGLEGRKHHRRSLTTLSLGQRSVGAVTPSSRSPRGVSPEAMRMSPLESRSSMPVRSPMERAVAASSAVEQGSVAEQAEGSYFTMEAQPQMSAQGIMSPEEVVTKERIDARRRSISTGRGSGSSGSSGGGLTIGAGMGMSALGQDYAGNGDE